jgi:hypothetical protein
LFNIDSFGNIYFTGAIAANSYPTITTTPTHVLVAGAGGIISRVAVTQLVSNTQSLSPVTSVFGRTGDIMPKRDDYNSSLVKEGSNLYFTNSRARAAISLTALGSTGPATYDPVTGVINVPQYQSDLNGVSSFNNRTGAVVLTALDVTNALTYTPIAVETDPVWTAQKTLYYTKVESDARFAAIVHTHTTTQVSEGTNLYYTDARARAAISLTTNGTSGVSTYINGVFNIPNYTTDLTGYATETYVNTQVSNLVDAAPTTLNTLNELAAALGDDANFSTTVTNLIGTKEPIIAPGTTSQYWRGDKTWQTLPIYTLSGLGGQPQLNGTGFVKASGTTISYDNSTYYLASNPSGYITGNQNITISGDVTGSGTTSIVTTIVNNAVTTTKINNGAITAAKMATFGAGEGFFWAANTDGASIIFESTGDGASGGRALSNLLIALTDNGDEGLKVTTTGSELLYVNINQFQYKGNNVWHAGNLTNLNQLTNGPGYITSASIGNGTLTLNVSGNGLSGSTSFTANQSGSTTFTVTSNASTSATANTLVYRDSAADIYARYFFGSYINTSDNDESGITRFVIKNGDNYHRSATTTVAANIIRGVASGTWSIAITGNAGSITNQANSATITASTGVNANHIVQRDGSGYIYANYINFNTSESENPTISSFFTSNGDGWSRKSSIQHVRNQLGISSSQWITSGSNIYYNAGNVLIGTASELPSSISLAGPFSSAAKLQIAGGDVAIASSGFVGLRIYSTAGGQGTAYCLTQNEVGSGMSMSVWGATRDAAGSIQPNYGVLYSTSDMVITSDSNIKFATSSGIITRLTITSGGESIFGYPVTVGALITAQYGTARIQVTSFTNNANSGVRFTARNSSSVSKNSGIYFVPGTNNTNTFISLAANDNDYQFNVLENGNVLIGTTDNNANKLRVNGTGFFDQSVTATSFFESSDATLKTLVEDNYQAKGIDSVVAKLYIKNGKQELGYYAQDLEGVLPSAVSKGSNGLLNLSYREVHTAKIAYLEEKIKKLEKLLSNGLE